MIEDRLFNQGYYRSVDDFDVRAWSVFMLYT